MTSIIKADAYKLLKSEIKHRGLKQGFVAEQIGIKPNYLTQVLNGHRPLTSNVALKVSTLLDIPVQKILNKS